MALGLNVDEAVVFISLFDAEGLVAKHTADEWDHTDIADLLHNEIGLPEPESQSVAERFLAGASSEGNEQPTDANTPIPAILFVVSILIVIGIGLWTIASWIL